jgi:hypothetical protein
MGDGGGANSDETKHYYVNDADSLIGGDGKGHAKLSFLYYVLEAKKETVRGIAEVRRLLTERIHLKKMDGLVLEQRERLHVDILTLLGPTLPEEHMQAIRQRAAAIFDSKL